MSQKWLIGDSFLNDLFLKYIPSLGNPDGLTELSAHGILEGTHHLDVELCGSGSSGWDNFQCFIIWLSSLCSAASCRCSLAHSYLLLADSPTTPFAPWRLELSPSAWPSHYPPPYNVAKLRVSKSDISHRPHRVSRNIFVKSRGTEDIRVIFLVIWLNCRTL